MILLKQRAIRRYILEHNSILVVDDDPSVRRIICRILNSQGMSTEEAADGMKAVQMAEATP